MIDPVDAWYAGVTYADGSRSQVWRPTQDEAWAWVARQQADHHVLTNVVMDANRRARSMERMRDLRREAADLASTDWSPVRRFVATLLDEDRQQRPQGRDAQDSTAVEHVLVMRTISALQECQLPPKTVGSTMLDAIIEPRDIWTLPVIEELADRHATLRRAAEANPAWWQQIEHEATAVVRAAMGGVAIVSVDEWLARRGYGYGFASEL